MAHRDPLTGRFGKRPEPATTKGTLMRFTPVAVSDIPEAMKKGRVSPAKTLIEEFLEANTPAARVDLNGSKAVSTGSTLRKWAKGIDAPVEVCVVGDEVFLKRTAAA